VVLEGIRRCGALGATCAYVGSDQPFYLSLGFEVILLATDLPRPLTGPDAFPGFKPHFGENNPKLACKKPDMIRV